MESQPRPELKIKISFIAGENLRLSCLWAALLRFIREEETKSEPFSM